MGKIELIEDDITKLSVDSIVNAANNSLLGGGGVDGAIHRGAGPLLLEECRGFGGCPTGEARITSAYNLPCKYIIHTVGPIWRGGVSGEAKLLASCYDNCFNLIAEYNIKTIAFPAVSTGVFNFPKEHAAQIAIFQTRKALNDNLIIEKVFFTCFNKQTLEAYNRALNDQGCK